MMTLRNVGHTEVVIGAIHKPRGQIFAPLYHLRLRGHFYIIRLMYFKIVIWLIITLPLYCQRGLWMTHTTKNCVRQSATSVIAEIFGYH